MGRSIDRHREILSVGEEKEKEKEQADMRLDEAATFNKCTQTI